MTGMDAATMRSMTVRLFRPTPDGELIDAADETVTLANDEVSLAHAATMTPAEVEAWRTHLRDYGIDPVFDQLDAAMPVFNPQAEAINDHEGWLSDTFAIRGRATKRGYTRSAAEDGGWFGEYEKPLHSANTRVVIELTGSIVPEELAAAAVKELWFERVDGRRVRLGEVPPVLLAQAYADYVFVASAGAYDPRWQDKSAY